MAAKARRPPRLKELAAELGLSITTVSRALAGYTDVAAATRVRVREMAAKRGYIPNRAGRMLVSGDSGFVGLVVPWPDSEALAASTYGGSLLGQFIMVLSDALTARGRGLAIATASRSRGEIEFLRHAVNGGQVDGVVLADRTVAGDGRVSFLIDQRVPFVVHGRVLEEERPYAWFDIDEPGAFAEAARMLIALGHRHFGLLTFAGPLSLAHFRRQGLEAVLHRNGLHLPAGAVAGVPRFDDREVHRAATRLLGLEPRPTAILCATDALAIKLIEVAAEQSIDVPGELSVTGFDNVPMSACAGPGITTFDPRIRDSAVGIADLVVRSIDGGTDDIASSAIKAKFVARGSHGPAPVIP